MAKQLTTYELAVLYNCNFEDVLEQTKAKINDLIIAHGGQIIEEDIWSKRKLAYPIKKQTQAIYVFYQIEVDGQKLTQIRNQLNVLEEVLRYQFYKPDKRALAAAESSTESAATPATV